MTYQLGRREFLGSVAAAALVGGCKVSTSAGGNTTESVGDLGKALQGIAESMLADFPENATLLGPRISLRRWPIICTTKRLPELRREKRGSTGD